MNDFRQFTTDDKIRAANTLKKAAEFCKKHPKKVHADHRRVQAINALNRLYADKMKKIGT